MTYKDIPGWFNFQDIYDEAVERVSDGAVLVEIGCWMGKSSAYLFQVARETQKKLKLCYVDTWKGSTNEAAQSLVIDRLGGDMYQKWWENMQACGATSDGDRPKVEAYRMRSVEASVLFEDGTVDFVFVDGGHDYASVTQDLNAWLPKLKPNGHIAGHDFLHPPVRDAVLSLIKARGRYYSWERIPVPE